MITHQPGKERATGLDLRMRTRLADSLDYVFSELGDTLGADARAADALIRSIRREPQSPQTFGLYYDLVLAVEREAFEESRLLAKSLLAAKPAAPFRLAAIQDRPPSERERYRRLFIEEPGLAGDPDDELLTKYQGQVAAAFELLDRGFPEMAEEIRTLLREIVVAAGPADPKAPTFDGASSYMLWGAILLNARGQDNILDTAQALAHESGHNLLFGYCADGSLVDNPDDELFSSPLRRDARPMDGVVHATYVISRMHQTLTRLLAANVLDERQQEAARKDLSAHSRNFHAGDQTIRDGARLTETGRDIMESARTYMASFATT